MSLETSNRCGSSVGKVSLSRPREGGIAGPWES